MSGYGGIEDMPHITSGECTFKLRALLSVLMLKWSSYMIFMSYLFWIRFLVPVPIQVEFKDSYTK